MAEYMVFIWDDEAAWAQADPATIAATMAAHEDFIARHYTKTPGPKARPYIGAGSAYPSDVS